MNDKLSNYFQNFNERLTDDLGSTFDYAKLIAYSKRKKDLLVIDSDAMDFPWLGELEEIVNKIKEIVNNVNSKIDPETPIANTEFETFEDRYIVFLIDQIASLLAVAGANLSSSTKNLRDFYIGGYIPITEARRLNTVNVLTSNNALFLKEERKIIELREAIGELITTNYYIKHKENIHFDEECVCINDVLANKPLYSECYDYYKTLKELRSIHYDLPKPVRGIDYQNYVFIALILALNERGFVLSGNSPEFDNKDYLLRIKNLKLARNNIILSISTDSDDHIDLVFEDNNSNFRKSKRTSKVSLDLYPYLNKELPSKEEASSYFRKKVKSRFDSGYQNAFVITAIEDVQDDHTIISSPLGNPLDANLSNMIEACLIYFPADTFTYSHFCPICGGIASEEDEEGNLRCSVCDSLYTLLTNKDQKEIIWVKRLNNLEGK